jgi:hypothetical protein
VQAKVDKDIETLYVLGLDWPAVLFFYYKLSNEEVR